MKADRLFPGLPIMVMLASCGESYTPGELAGSYGLTAIESRAPPYLELATVECDQWIVGGILILHPDASHDLNLSIELDCTRGGGQVSVQERSYGGTFSVDDDRLEFSSPQPVGGPTVFGGRVRGEVVDVALPSEVVGLDPLLDVRFDERICADICPFTAVGGVP